MQYCKQKEALGVWMSNFQAPSKTTCSGWACDWMLMGSITVLSVLKRSELHQQCWPNISYKCVSPNILEMTNDKSNISVNKIETENTLHKKGGPYTLWGSHVVKISAKNPPTLREGRERTATSIPQRIISTVGNNLLAA